MILYYAAIGVLSFITAFILTYFLIPRLKRTGMTGKDENKRDAPEVAEMGGLAIVAGFTAGVLLAIFFNSFQSVEFNLTHVLAAVITILSIAIMGMVDDLLSIPQWLKAILPLFAAVPLVAAKVAGSTIVVIPFIGALNFGIIYIIILIPLAIAVCSNLTNMLAGFNGLETGMAAVMFAALAIIGLGRGSVELAILSISMFSALLAFLAFNIYPAKVFPGDVGNLTIGVVLACIVIIGNLESAGIILMTPYIVDFFIKAKNRFPHTYQEIREDDKLYPKEGKIKGLVHLVMVAFGGVTEKNLTLFFIALESFFALVAILLYAKLF